MRTAFLFALALAAVGLTCGSRDPLAEVREQHPGGVEYRAWKNYVLVRFAVDDAEPDVEPALLLKREADEWSVLARSAKGFRNGYEVTTYIPELDEDGVAAFGLD